MDPDDLSTLILQAALDRAAQGPFAEDGSLTPEAAAEVQAIADLASDDPEEMEALAAELAGEEDEEE